MENISNIIKIHFKSWYKKNGYLINNISIMKSVNELFHLAISNNYHQIIDYQNNLVSIKKLIKQLYKDEKTKK
jgi:lipoprotein NlpI